MSVTLEPSTNIVNTTATIGLESKPTKANHPYQNDNTMVWFALIIVAISSLGIIGVSLSEAKAKRRKKKEEQLAAERVIAAELAAKNE